MSYGKPASTVAQFVEFLFCFSSFLKVMSFFSLCFYCVFLPSRWLRGTIEDSANCNRKKGDIENRRMVWQQILIFLIRKNFGGKLSHSSEISGLCSMKSASETLQNLPYFWNMKTYIVFSFCATLFFCPGLFQHRPGHSLGKK